MKRSALFTLLIVTVSVAAFSMPADAQKASRENMPFHFRFDNIKINSLGHLPDSFANASVSGTIGEVYKNATHSRSIAVNKGLTLNMTCSILSPLDDPAVARDNPTPLCTDLTKAKNLELWADIATSGSLPAVGYFAVLK